MQTTILTQTHYDAVRGLIAPDVTDKHISDEYLSQLPFAPTAEKTVRRRLELSGVDIDSLDAGSIEDVLLAMMHACAAVLCLTAPQLLRQSGLQVSTEVQRVNWQEKRQFHLDEVDSKIETIQQSLGETPKSDAVRRYVPFRAVG